MGGRHHEVCRRWLSRRWRHRARLRLRRRRPRTAREVHAAVGNTIPGSLRAVERALSRFDLGRSSGRGVGIDDRDKSGQGEIEGGGIRLLTRRISGRVLNTYAAKRKKGTWLLFASARHFTLRREMPNRHPPSAAPRHTRIPAIGEDPTKQESHGFD